MNNILESAMHQFDDGFKALEQRKGYLSQFEGCYKRHLEDLLNTVCGKYGLDVNMFWNDYLHWDVYENWEDSAINPVL